MDRRLGCPSTHQGRAIFIQSSFMLQERSHPQRKARRQLESHWSGPRYLGTELPLGLCVFLGRLQLIDPTINIGLQQFSQLHLH